MTGLFISLEGIEGSGKTTQITKLVSFLQNLGHDITVTKEPGGTALGNELRNMLLNRPFPFTSKHTELMLFMADRFEHIEQVIKPALSAGKIVICDRYLDSTVAYQVGGRELPHQLIDTLHQQVDVIPHITLLLDLPPEIGLARAKNRAPLDAFEKETLAFHHRIRATYLEQAKIHPNRIKVIHSESLSPEETFKAVITALTPCLPT